MQDVSTMQKKDRRESEGAKCAQPRTVYNKGKKEDGRRKSGREGLKRKFS